MYHIYELFCYIEILCKLFMNCKIFVHYNTVIWVLFYILQVKRKGLQKKYCYHDHELIVILIVISNTSGIL